MRWELICWTLEYMWWTHNKIELLVFHIMKHSCDEHKSSSIELVNKCIEFINLWDEIIEKFNGKQSLKMKKN